MTSTMNECLWIKQGNRLVPADPVTEEILAATKNGALVTTSPPRSRRNPDHHRYMMSILQAVVDNTDAFADVEDLIFHLKMRTKMYRLVKVYPDRESIPVAIYPRSISFAAMSQQQFKRVCDRWLWVIANEIMPGVDPESLLPAREDRRSAA